MKRIKLFILSLVVSLGLGGGMLVPVIVHATPKSTVCSTLGAGSDCGTQPSNGINLNTVLTTVINLISVFSGIVAVIMVMLSGFRYITSGGDSSKVAGAKNALIYAIVGLVVVALSQSIVKFVLNKIK